MAIPFADFWKRWRIDAATPYGFSGIYVSLTARGPNERIPRRVLVTWTCTPEGGVLYLVARLNSDVDRGNV